MIEIFALIYFSRKMGELALQKGLKKGLWQFFTVLTWFGAEVFGAVLSVLIFKTDELLSMLPLAYVCAIGSYFLLRSILSKKPDAVESAFEFEQQR
jgi:hypothetical protein